MPGRKYQAVSGYRYGFNGKEDDKDAGGSIQDYGMRIYDVRIAKFLSVDPLTNSFPYYSPYQFAGNTPVQAIDLDGGEPEFIINKYGHLTRPMINMFHAAFGYNKAKMQNTVWIKIHAEKFSANTIFTTIFYNKESAEQGNRDYNVWVDYWLNLTVHEHKHRDEYTIFQWIDWGLKYLVEIKKYDKTDANGGETEPDDGYPKYGPTEKRAYPMEDPMVDLMNQQNSFALKVLESGDEYNNNTKSGLMRYIGFSFVLQKDGKALSTLKGWLESDDFSDQAKKMLRRVVVHQERRLARLSKKVDRLKSKYSKEIDELHKKEGRKVEKVETRDKLNASIKPE